MTNWTLFLKTARSATLTIAGNRHDRQSPPPRLDRLHRRCRDRAAAGGGPPHAPVPPAFGTPVPNATGKTDPAGLLLWGIDELITYHYLIAEVFRVVPATKLPYEQFWKMSKT